MTAKERRHASMKGANMMPLDKRTEVLETEAMRLRVDMGELEEIAREQMEDDQNV